MNAFFKEIFEYNHSSNQRLITAINEQSDKVSERSVKWINHMLNAHQVWINRIEPKDEPYGVWQIHSIGYLKDIDKLNYDRTLDVLDRFDLGHLVNYTNTRGEAFTNTVKDILFHAANHSTYHRGQIASDFKASGITPLVTDYIFYKR